MQAVWHSKNQKSIFEQQYRIDDAVVPVTSMNVSYAEIILAGCILLLPFLYESSHVFRYYLKFFIYYSMVMCCSLFMIPIICFTPGDITNFLYGAAFCKHISSILGLRWTARGKEHLGKDEPFIIVSNHQSSIDVLGMFEVWHIMRKCTVVAKKALLYAGPFGFASWLCGMIFIDRVRSNSAQNTVNTAAQIIKEKKAKLWVFPEGTRRNTGEIHPFKKGAFHIAISAQIPILPVVLSRYYFLDEKERRFDQGHVIMTALPPIPTMGMTADDVSELMEQTRDCMITAFQKINKEVLDLVDACLKEARYRIRFGFIRDGVNIILLQKNGLFYEIVVGQVLVCAPLSDPHENCAGISSDMLRFQKELILPRLLQNLSCSIPWDGYHFVGVLIQDAKKCYKNNVLI